MKNSETELIRTAVFDVCDTMYYSNTTHDFVRFVFAKQPFSTKKLIHRLFNDKIFLLRYLLIAASLATGFDLLKNINLYLLKGMTSNRISVLSALFVEEFLADKHIDQTHRLIEECARAGLRVVLCSSSIEPVIKAVAENLGVKDYVATSLEFAGENFTGKILVEITDKKLEALKKRELSGVIEYAVSDNITDVALLSAAKKGVAVAHDAKKREFWKRHQFEIINLNL